MGQDFPVGNYTNVQIIIAYTGDWFVKECGIALEEEMKHFVLTGSVMECFPVPIHPFVF